MILFNFIFHSSHQTCPPNTRAFAENSSSSETNIGANTLTYQSHEGEEKMESAASAPDGNQSDATRSAIETTAAGASSKQTTQSEHEERKLWNHSMKSSSTYLQLASRPRQKYVDISAVQIRFDVLIEFCLPLFKGTTVQRDASRSQSNQRCSQTNERTTFGNNVEKCQQNCAKRMVPDIQHGKCSSTPSRRLPGLFRRIFTRFIKIHCKLNWCQCESCHAINCLQKFKQEHQMNQL